MHDEQTARLETRIDYSRVLDRRYDLSSIPLEILGWIGLLVVAATIRLIGRTNWPLSPFESAIAHDGWAWIHGAELSANAATYPLLIQLTSLSFFLFGDTDFTARLAPLVASLLTLLVMFGSRAWIGSLPALSISIIWTVSPVMTMSAMRIDGIAIVLFGALLALSLVVSLAHRPSTTEATVLGIALAILVGAHPVGWLFLVSTLGAALLLLGNGFRLRELSAAATSFTITLALSASWFMTRPQMVLDYLTGNPASLWNDYLNPAGALWGQMLMVLLSDELLATLLTFVGACLLAARLTRLSSAAGTLALAGVVWATPLIAFGFLNESGSPGAYAVGVLPFLVFGGFALSSIIRWIGSGSLLPLQVALGTVAAAGFIVALFRLVELVSGGPGDQMFRWTLNVLALLLLILAPLGYLVFRWFRNARSLAVPTALLGITVLLVLVGIRSSVLLSSVDTPRSGEILTAGSTASAVSIIEQRLVRYSLDATAYIQDVRDPAGGRGLVIAIDERVADPFAWYFRDFPDARVISSSTELDPEEPPDAILTVPDEVATFIGDVGVFYRSRDYAFVYALPNSLSRSAAGRYLLELMVPGTGQNFSEYLIYRRTADPVERSHFTLLLLDEHAEAIWGD